MADLLHALWEELKSKVLNQHLTNTTDIISWGQAKPGKFTIESTYEHLTTNEHGEPNTRI